MARSIDDHSQACQTGTVLRLKGKGLPHAARAGDRRPICAAGGRTADGTADEELERRSTDWEAAHPYDPRAILMREARA